MGSYLDILEKSPREKYCSYCGADPGEPCETSSGNKAREPHAARTRIPYGRISRETRGEDTYEKSEAAKLLERDVLSTLASGSFGARGYIDPRNSMQYDPPEDRRIQPGGQYVTILRSPPLEQADNLIPGTTLWATQQPHSDEYGFDSNGYYKICVTFEGHTLYLWAYEYTILSYDTILDLWQRGELVFHPKKASPETFSKRMFYVQTRGIDVARAMVMCLGDVTEDIGWFEPRDDLKEILQHW